MSKFTPISSLRGLTCGLALLVSFLAIQPATADDEINGYSTWTPRDYSASRDDYYGGDRYGDRYSDRYARDRGYQRYARYDRYEGDSVYGEGYGYEGRYRRGSWAWKRDQYRRRAAVLKPVERNRGEKWRRKKTANYSITTVNPRAQEVGQGVYHTIREAIDNTTPGGTVLITPGQYAESLIITWPVFLRADVRNEANLDERTEAVRIHPSAGQACVAVKVEDNELVSIRDIKFALPSNAGSEPCIIHRKGNLVVQDTEILANKESIGVFLAGGSAQIDNVYVEGANVGIYVAPTSGARSGRRGYDITRSEVRDSDVGINVDAYDVRVNLSKNQITGNDEAGLIATKGDIEANRNEINDNVGDGVVVLYPSNFELNGNVLHGNGRYGVYLPLSDRISLDRNVISCNEVAGIQSGNRHDYDDDDDLDEIASDQYPGNEFQYNSPRKRKRKWWKRLTSSRDDFTPEEYCMEPPYMPEDDEDAYDSFSARDDYALADR